MANDHDGIHKGFYERGYLPHFDEPGLYQSITFRLVDSISPKRMSELKHEYLSSDLPDYFELLESELDMNFGKCWLRNPMIAGIVRQALLRSSGKEYDLIAWVVMPNHVHSLIHHLDGYSLSGIVRNWKAWSAVRANKVLGRSGRFWQVDYFDRFIRSRNHLSQAADYIHYNPVAARLCSKMEEWPWSSYRMMHGLED